MDSHTFIPQEINLHSKVWSAGVSLQTGVPGTIERDLQKPFEEGKTMTVPRVTFSRSVYHQHHTPTVVYVYTQKNSIAQKAIALIEKGTSTLTSGGAGFTKIAGALSPDFHTNFISGIAPALFVCSSQTNIEVIVTGDRYSKNAIGPEAIIRIMKSSVGLYFPGIKAVKPQSLFSDNNRNV